MLRDVARRLPESTRVATMLEPLGARQPRPDVQRADQHRPRGADRRVRDARAARRDGRACPLPARRGAVDADQAEGPAPNAHRRRARAAVRGSRPSGASSSASRRRIRKYQRLARLRDAESRRPAELGRRARSWRPTRRLVFFGAQRPGEAAKLQRTFHLSHAAAGVARERASRRVSARRRRRSARGRSSGAAVAGGRDARELANRRRPPPWNR